MMVVRGLSYKVRLSSVSCLAAAGISSVADSPSIRPAWQARAHAVEGGLRLVTRRELNGYAIGALQVFADGAFGTVCGAFFSNVEADVACRKLGFSGGGTSPFADEALTQAELLVCPCMQDVLPSVTCVPRVFGSL